jgi:hypothetical protein
MSDSVVYDPIAIAKAEKKAAAAQVSVYKHNM